MIGQDDSGQTGIFRGQGLLGKPQAQALVGEVIAAVGQQGPGPPLLAPEKRDLSPSSLLQKLQDRPV